MRIQKKYWFVVILILLFFVGAEVYSYGKALKDIDNASAVTVGVPNPGHSLSQFECSANSLCVDTANGRVGIGTANPTTKLDVNGVLNLNSNKITGVATPTASSDAATKAYVDAAGGSTACRSNFGNLCINGGGLAFTYAGGTEYIDAYPRSASWYTSGSSTGQSLAWQMCGAIGARLATLAEWQTACAALGGPTGNGTTTFGGVNRSDNWEWVADPYSGAAYNAVLAGGGSCTGTLYTNTNGTNSSNRDNYWFRCVR
jgi:hypothetical protein